MEENNGSNYFWIIIVIIAVIYFAVSFLGDYGKYQGKSAHEWYNAYINEKDLLTQKDQQKQALQTCLDQADTNHTTNWTNECKDKGIDNTGPNCSLPLYIADRVNNISQQDKDNCFKQFPQN
jgi:Sec-independent protein translocase protein TatA